MLAPPARNQGNTDTATPDLDGFCEYIRGSIVAGDAEYALEQAEKVAIRAGSSGECQWEARALLLAAEAHAAFKPESPETTADFAIRAAEALREEGDADGELHALRLVVEAFLKVRRVDETAEAAQALYRRSSKISASGNLTAWATTAMGRAHLFDGRVEAASEAANKAMALCDAEASDNDALDCQILECDVHLASGREDAALQAALAIVESAKCAASATRNYKTCKGLAVAYGKLADVHDRSDRFVEALRAAEKSIENWKRCGDQSASVDCLIIETRAKWAICSNRRTLRELNFAKATVAAAEKFCRHDGRCCGDAYLVYAQVLLGAGSYKEAEFAVDRASKFFRKARERRRRAEALLLSAEVELKRGYLQDARAETHRALDLFDVMGDPQGKDKALKIEDQINAELGIPTRAEVEQKALESSTQFPPSKNLGQLPISMESAAAQEPDLQAAAPVQKTWVLDAGMTLGNIREKIIDVVRSIGGNDDLTDVDVPLMEAGVTSNMAILLRDQLGRDISGITLPPTLIFDYPSVAEIASLIAEKVGL